MRLSQNRINQRPSVFVGFAGEIRQGAAGPARRKPSADRKPRGSDGRTLPPDPSYSACSCRSTSFPGGLSGSCGTLYTAHRTNCLPASNSRFLMAKTRLMPHLIPTVLPPSVGRVQPTYQAPDCISVWPESPLKELCFLTAPVWGSSLVPRRAMLS